MEIVERQVAAPAGETKGPECFLVHGAWRNASVWKPLAQELAAADRPSTAISLPGRGTSTMHKGEIGHYTVQDGMRLVAAELGRLKAAPVLVAHDVSCALALRVAAERPLAALILISPPPAGGLKGLFTRLAMRQPLWAAREFSSGFERPWRSKRALAARIFNAEATAELPEFEPESKSVMGEFFFSFPATLEALEVPTLVVTGSASPFRPKGAQRFADKLGAELQIVEGGALDLLREPLHKRTAEAIEEFLARRL